jgi:ankyrin repeat protein
MHNRSTTKCAYVYAAAVPPSPGPDTFVPVWFTRGHFKNKHFMEENLGERARIFARDGDVEGLRHELAADPRVAHARDWGGWTALHYASQSGRVECVQLLLSQRADPNQPDSDDWLPLHIAALNDNAAVAQRLLSTGSDPRRRTASGRSAWEVAPSTGEIRTLGVLLRGDSDLSDRDGGDVGGGSDDEDDSSDASGDASTDASDSMEIGE